MKEGQGKLAPICPRGKSIKHQNQLIDPMTKQEKHPSDRMEGMHTWSTSGNAWHATVHMCIHAGCTSVHTRSMYIQTDSMHMHTDIHQHKTRLQLCEMGARVAHLLCCAHDENSQQEDQC